MNFVVSDLLCDGLPPDDFAQTEVPGDVKSIPHAVLMFTRDEAAYQTCVSRYHTSSAGFCQSFRLLSDKVSLSSFSLSFSKFESSIKMVVGFRFADWLVISQNIRKTRRNHRNYREIMPH